MTMPLPTATPITIATRPKLTWVAIVTPHHTTAPPIPPSNAPARARAKSMFSDWAARTCCACCFRRAKQSAQKTPRAVRTVATPSLIAVLHSRQRRSPVFASSTGSITSWQGRENTGDHRCLEDRKSTRLNSSHRTISYAVFCLRLHDASLPLSLHDALPISCCFRRAKQSAQKTPRAVRTVATPSLIAVLHSRQRRSPVFASSTGSITSWQGRENTGDHRCL